MDVVRAAAYPPDANPERILREYRASSDQPLMDRLVRCRGCGLVYTSPRFDDAVISSSYSEAVDPAFFTQNALRVATFKRILTRILADVRLRPDRSMRVLDVGCGGGAFVKVADDFGFTAIGIEPSRWMADRARTEYGIDVREGTLSDHSFPPASFKIISLWDVIEHIPNPGRELEAIHGLLADDGYLIVNWPDYGSLARKLLGWKWPFFLNVHLFYFTRRTLSALLKRHGFEVRLTRPHEQTLELGYVLKRASRVIPFLLPLVYLAKGLMLSRLPVRYNVGQSLLVASKARA